MKRFSLILTVMCLAVAGLSSCNGGTAKKAADLFKKSSKVVGKYGDDVARRVKLEDCKNCRGRGCSKCGGDGKVVNFNSR